MGEKKQNVSFQRAGIFNTSITGVSDLRSRHPERNRTRSCGDTKPAPGQDALLTGGLHFVDILQEVLPLVDDVEGQVIHGQSLVRVVLQALLCYCEVLRVKVIHLLRKLVIPGLKV